MNIRKYIYKMKQKYLVVIGFVIGISVAIIANMLFECKTQNNNHVCSFIYEGKKYNKESFSYSNNNGYLNNPNYPQSVNEMGIIRNDSMAYQLSSLVIKDIYGEDCLIKEAPAHISLINDSIWHVSGSLPKTCIGGTYSILIERFSGKILRVTHGK